MVKHRHSREVKLVRPHIPAGLLIALLLGLTSQIVQVVLLRELLMVFHGNELSIGLIFAAWMAWMGLGSYLGGTISSRYARTANLLRASAVGLLLTLPVTIVLIRELRNLIVVPPAAQLSLLDIAISSALLMAPACLFMGMHFVYVVKLWREADKSTDSSATGKTYISEALGSALGGIIFTTFLIHVLNPLQTVAAAALVLLLVVLLSQGLIRSRPWIASVGFAVLVGIVLALMVPLDQWAHNRHWQHFLPRHELLDMRPSKYGNIAVVRYADQYTFYQSGQLVFSTAGADELRPGWEAQDSVAFAHLAMVQYKDPQRVLLLGGGLGGTLGEITKHPVTAIDYVELDEVLLQAARPHLPAATLDALADPRVRLLHGDARLYVKTAATEYDLIIVDLPDPATAVLNRYYTKEFFAEAASLLGPNGVLVLHSSSTPQLHRTAVANRNAAIYHTLRSVFEHVVVAGDRVLVYIASQDGQQPNVDPVVLRQRYEERGIVTDGFAGSHFHTWLEPTSVRRVNWILRNHGRTATAHLTGPGPQPLLPGSLEEQALQEAELPSVHQRYFINSDFKPIGYFYTLMLWDDITRPFHQSILPMLLHARSWWVLPVAAVPLLLMLVVVLGIHRQTSNQRALRRVGIRLAVLTTVLTTGMSTMMLQITLLFAFQSVYGFVYELVGLITAFFMLGLAGGAWLAHRSLVRRFSLSMLAVIQLLMALVCLVLWLGLPVIVTLRSPAFLFGLFAAVTATAGLINGVDFPVAAACYTALHRQPEKSAGVIYAGELFGACISAALASTVVVPIFGVGAAFLVAAGVSGIACLLLLIARRWSYA